MGNKYPLVLIYWEDHTASAHWITEDHYKNSNTSTAVTIGWKVFEDSKKVVIHSSYIDDNDEYITSGNESVIVKKAIVKEYYLELIDS